MTNTFLIIIISVLSIAAVKDGITDGDRAATAFRVPAHISDGAPDKRTCSTVDDIGRDFIFSNINLKGATNFCICGQWTPGGEYEWRSMYHHDIATGNGELCL